MSEHAFATVSFVTRLRGDVIRVKDMLHEGLTVAEAARRSGVPRGTIRYWVAHGLEATVERAPRPCTPCARTSVVPPDSYAYLLGLYLGDGCLSASARNVYKLRIVLDVRYPGIIGVACRQSSQWHVSISRRVDVDRMDALVGPKY